jgi:hypothetical protein
MNMESTSDSQERVWELEKQIADLQAEVARLKEGQFSEAEFQNLCHNMRVDGQPITYETVHSFEQGCVEYRRKLFGEMAMQQKMACEILAHRVKLTRSFTLQTEQGPINVTEYVVNSGKGDELKMVWVRDNMVERSGMTGTQYPLFVTDLPAKCLTPDKMFKCKDCNEARAEILHEFCEFYKIAKATSI